MLLHKAKWTLYEGMEVLTIPIMVIFSPHLIQRSDYHVVHLKLTYVIYYNI